MTDTLYSDRFECGPGIRLQAHERVAQVHFDHINTRLDKLEELMERLEKSLWLTAYGVAAVVLAQAFQSFMVGIPN
jgi:Tfp pilus assembly protein PilN